MVSLTSYQIMLMKALLLEVWFVDGGSSKPGSFVKYAEIQTLLLLLLNQNPQFNQILHNSSAH